MKVVVVGGAGFIGSHLAERLVVEGHSVDVVDSLSSGSLANLATARTMGGDLTIHTLDAATEGFETLLARRRPDVIYHLSVLSPPLPSAAGGPPGATDRGLAIASLQQTITVLEAARATGTTKVVMALSAVDLYGEVASKQLPVKESQPWSPISVAGVMWRAIADLLAIYREQHAVEFTALAVANVYGPRQRSAAGVVAAFVAAARERTAPVIYGDGRHTRDFIYVDDAVDALVRAATKGSGLVLNVGTGIATSILDLWTLLADANGEQSSEPKFSPQRPYDVARSALSPMRARIHLGWSPWTQLADGVASVLAES
ncbi:MAG: NAD-dependent epimerase/dehydratase family protein [Actinobacteria bacterium]|nr:NAD-dependent epimerase/dehydratase family protein [Actinomycetota bacterium]